MPKRWPVDSNEIADGPDLQEDYGGHPGMEVSSRLQAALDDLATDVDNRGLVGGVVKIGNALRYLKNPVTVHPNCAIAGPIGGGRGRGALTGAVFAPTNDWTGGNTDALFFCDGDGATLANIATACSGKANISAKTAGLGATVEHCNLRGHALVGHLITNGSSGAHDSYAGQYSRYNIIQGEQRNAIPILVEPLVNGVPLTDHRIQNNECDGHLLWGGAVVGLPTAVDILGIGPIIGLGGGGGGTYVTDNHFTTNRACLNANSYLSLTDGHATNNNFDSTGAGKHCVIAKLTRSEIRGGDVIIGSTNDTDTSATDGTQQLLAGLGSGILIYGGGQGDIIGVTFLGRQDTRANTPAGTGFGAGGTQPFATMEYAVKFNQAFNAANYSIERIRGGWAKTDISNVANGAQTNFTRSRNRLLKADSTTVFVDP